MIHFHGRKHKITIPPHFYDPEALIISTSKLTLLGIFHAIPPLMMVPNSLALRISPAKWFLMQSTILMHPKPLAPIEFQPLSLRCVLQGFLLFLISYNKCLAESCFPSCWKSSSVVPVFKNGEKSDPGKYLLKPSSYY